MKISNNNMRIVVVAQRQQPRAETATCVFFKCLLTVQESVFYFFPFLHSHQNVSKIMSKIYKTKKTRIKIKNWKKSSPAK